MNFLNEFTALFFTCLAVAALSNSVNLTDGLNGLSSGSIIISLFLISMIAISVGDKQIFYSSIFYNFNCCVFSSIGQFLKFF